MYGIRAPVETSFKTILCTPTTDNPFATGWIALEQANGPGITQAGIIHLFRNGGAQWCRVWAIGTGQANVYDCGAQSNGTFVYFLINVYTDVSGNFYDIKDCGTAGGYGNCTVLNNAQPEYNEPLGAVSAETNNYWCTVQIMGSASAPQNYGTSTNPIEGLVSAWGPRTWNYQSQDNRCPSDYKGAQAAGSTSATISTWDSRN
jgi:hypothetical protein